MSNPPNNVPNPYVGPRSFQMGERMYGRTRETTQLLNLIIAERIVLLHSPSGAGKTSLIQAALIPKLKEKNFQLLPVVRVNLDVADTLAKGFECNRYVFSALLSLEEDVPEKEKISADWLAKMSLPEYLEKRYWPEDSPNLKMLIFDQFEEIITLDPTDQSEKEEFFKQVGEALEISSRWALFAIRDDFVASLDPYLLWIPNRMSVNFRLDLLGISAARRAIQEPTRDAGVEFADDAAEKLVDDLRRVRVQQPDGNVVLQLGPHIEPVQLQVVCFRIWEDPRPDPSRITADDLEELDQEDYSLVDRSLTDYYSRRVIATAGATGTSERVIREWFDRRLITEQGLRGTVLMGADTSGGLDNNAIKLLVDAHLVRAEKRGGATWYELSHDRLLEPIRINNLTWYNENLSLLQRQADLWHEGGRKAGVLLVGEALEEAEQWAAENETKLTEVEQDFLKASQEQREHEQRERALERERLEAAEKLAEEKTRSARRARRWTIAIGIIGLLSLILAAVAFILYDRNRATTNFIDNIEACEGSDRESCLAAAGKAVNENEYLLLVASACDEAMREAVQSDDLELIIASEEACEQFLRLSSDPSSLPQLNDLCDSIWYLLGSNDVLTNRICEQALRLALEVDNLAQVADTCAVGTNAELKPNDLNPVCQRTSDLMMRSEDIPSLRDICTDPFYSDKFNEDIIRRACNRYFSVAIESSTPNVLHNLCYEAEQIKESGADARMACKKAVDLAIENNVSYIALDLCIPDENLDVDVQYACDGYREIATKLADSSIDVYELNEICNFGASVGLPTEVVLNACERGIQLIADVNDPSLQKELCYAAQDIESKDALNVACNHAVESAIESEDINLVADLCWNIRQGWISYKDSTRVCGEYENRSEELVDITTDVYLLETICTTGTDSGLPEDIIRVACERGAELAVDSDDLILMYNLCSTGRDIEITGDGIDSLCSQMANLVIQNEHYDLGYELCWDNPRYKLSERDFQSVCAMVAEMILPGESISDFLEIGERKFWSFQGEEGQIVTMYAESNDNALLVIVSLPNGERIFEQLSNSNDPLILFDRQQLPESGIYIIGVHNPDNIPGEYFLELSQE